MSAPFFYKYCVASIGVSDMIFAIMVLHSPLPVIIHCPLEPTSMGNWRLLITTFGSGIRDKSLCAAITRSLWQIKNVPMSSLNKCAGGKHFSRCVEAGFFEAHGTCFHASTGCLPSGILKVWSTCFQNEKVLSLNRISCSSHFQHACPFVFTILIMWCKNVPKAKWIHDCKRFTPT